MSSGIGLKYRDIQRIFNTEVTKMALLKAESDGRIPKADRISYGKSSITHRIWPLESVSIIGEKYGFLEKPTSPSTICVFSTKGGVLKSTISLNIARMYALHNIKTCVIDLDPQGDTSRNLGFSIPEDEIEDLTDVDKYENEIENLASFFHKKSKLEDIIQNTELPTLDVILSSSALIPLMDSLNAVVRREYWIKENVINNLYKMGYDLVIIDLAPSWNIYTSNSITAASLLVSPLECKIAHYRNCKEFNNQLTRFCETMKITDQKRIFIPTRVSSQRKVSVQIRQFYASNIPDCSMVSIRESVFGEEAIATRKSILEYCPTKTVAEDMREFLVEVNQKLQKSV
jgi:chromosome partitioning protein